MRDYQKSKVYHAEYSLGQLYDFAAQASHTTVVLNGVTLQLEPEAKFGDIASVQAYVDRVTELIAQNANQPRQSISVRERKGDRHAHYQGGVIAVHSGRNNWGMREIVILHEIAHHLDRDHISHGPNFTYVLADLVELVIGPQAALALRMLYQMEGVDVGKAQRAREMVS